MKKILGLIAVLSIFSMPAWAMKQKWYGGGGGLVLSTTTTYYFNLCSPASHNSSASSIPIAAASGNMRKLTVQLEGDPDTGGSAKGYIFTVYVNGSPTAETVTILSSTSGWQATYVGADVAFTKNQTLGLQAAPTGSPANIPQFSFSLELECTTSNTSIYSGSGFTGSSVTETRYMPPVGDLSPITTVNRTLMVFSVAGTIPGFSGMISAAPGTTSVRYLKLQKFTGAGDGTASYGDTTMTWTSAVTGAQDLTFSTPLSIAAGDRINFEWSTNGTAPASAYQSASIIFKPTTDGLFMIPFGAAGTVTSSSSTNYQTVAGSFNGMSSTQALRHQILSNDITLKGLTVWLDGALSSGSWTISLQHPDATPASVPYSTSISAQGPTSATPADYDLSGNGAYDIYSVKTVPSSPNTTLRFNFTFTALVNSGAPATVKHRRMLMGVGN